GPPHTKGASTAEQARAEGAKLALIRFVSGEFDNAVKSVADGNQGFDFPVGKPLNTELLDRAVATRGAAVNSGDNVQITQLEFRAHEIVVDLNGGGRGKHHWRDHLQIGIGGSYPTMQSTQETGPPGLQPGMGSTIFLDWKKFVPDMTPAELKRLLWPFLNFQNEPFSSCHWSDTLPP